MRKRCLQGLALRLLPVFTAAALSCAAIAQDTPPPPQGGDLTPAQFGAVKDTAEKRLGGPLPLGVGVADRVERL